MAKLDAAEWTRNREGEKGNNNVNVTTIIIDFTDWLYLLKK